MSLPYFTVTVYQNIQGTPPLTDATVVLTLISSGSVYTATTAGDGTAIFTSPEGAYDLEISKNGYEPYTYSPISFGYGGGFIAALFPAGGGDGGGDGGGGGGGGGTVTDWGPAVAVGIIIVGAAVFMGVKT